MVHQTRIRVLAVIMIGALFGCSEPPPVETGGGGGGMGGAPADAAIDVQVFPDYEPPDNFVEQPPVDCNNYTYRDTLYNCGAMDFCPPNEDFQARLACCECDPIYCNPPPPDSCPELEPDPDAPPPPPPPENEVVESCMSCHNGAREHNDYSGAGMSNPHPFPGADKIKCTSCHGGTADGTGPLGSHVPAPPSIRGDQLLINDQIAYFNKLTMTGLDKLEPAVYDDPNNPGKQWTNLDYIQFINPGDLRIVSEGRGCGEQGCHFNQHAQWVPKSPIATSMGILGGSRFAAGADNRIAEYRGREDGDSRADVAPRAVQNPAYDPNSRVVGEVGQLIEQREIADYNGDMRDNAIYLAAQIPNYVDNTDPTRPNRIKYNSPLDQLWDEQNSMVCGDCHLYSAGANNRYADFRSSGCTACHMQYSLDGRSRSSDRNVNKYEPANPDAIAAPERPHIESHQIRNVAKLLPDGSFLRGISDQACVGCHQGSNRTVLQFWGIRLDQNQDLVNEFQYPANPDTFTTTQNDQRLYSAAAQNATFNGRNFNQHILTEDYDADGRDDTPPDAHYEAGLGCIDCHGSRDLHGGQADDPSSGKIVSRMDQGTFITCESCHGSIEEYAESVDCTNYQRQPARCLTDRNGNALRHVTVGAQGDVYLISKLTGDRHYVPQTKDTVLNNGKTNPLTAALVYSPKASYAMGRNDGNDATTGIGPKQTDPANARLRQPNGFSHMDKLDCAACHASWTNACVGCHLKGEYDANPANYFASNITGKRILLNFDAQFVYQTPVPLILGVNGRGKIIPISTQGFFYRYQDYEGNESDILAFSDRLGQGNYPGNGNGDRNPFPALQEYSMAAHSTRGTVTGQYEGPRYCVSCHLNTEQLDNFGDDYAQFIEDYDQNNNLADLNFNLLQEHIGQNTGNQLNSPFFVHMAAGKGTGLFLFDANGCPINPFDANANREHCNGTAPADDFANAINDNVVYDLDRLVEFTGLNNSGDMHPIRNPLDPNIVRRLGAGNPEMGGTLPGTMIEMLSNPNTGVVLDSWIDADGNAQGDAANYIQ